MGITLLQSLHAWWPETILSAGALLVMLLGAGGLRWTRAATLLTWVTLLGCEIALTNTPALPSTMTFFGLILCDPFSLAIRWVVLGTLTLVVAFVMASHEIAPEKRAEVFGLLLLAGVGLMLMAEANHLLMAYLAMELVSLTSYVLVGAVGDARSAEASLKYLLIGALSSGIMVFGISLLFGQCGTLAFPSLRHAVAGLTGAEARLLLVAAALILAGLAFKISMVPFHFWTPDAYEGAPLPITAFLSVAPKAAGLALLVRAMQPLTPAWPALEPLLMTLTIVTMTFGNVVALVQTNVKRLFAYSTIAQVGYLLIGFVVGSARGLEGMLAYLLAYLFMNLGVFACLIAVEHDAHSESIEAFRGLAQRAPGLALACALFLLSLAGIPPLLGFFGKFLLFGAAIETQRPLLAVAGAINSAIALYYYVNLIRLMYVVAPSTMQPLRLAPVLRIVIGVCVLGTCALGLFPSLVLRLLGTSVVASLL